MSRVRALQDAGVSIWLDTLSRELLESGMFARLIDDYAVTGATSNPTIFARAITGSDRYDEQLRAAVASRIDDEQEIFFDLALEDVRRAADMLRPVFDDNGGSDGFVSFECTPDLAHDAEATIEQAHDLWARIDRPNAMIKVPATTAGLTAIEEVTVRGVNMNVTLLFSVARYEQVIDAHQRGLERRLAAGDPIHAITSVASFFVRASTPRSTRCCRRTPVCAAAWPSPTRGWPMPATWTASATSPPSPMTAGTRFALRALARSDRCGRARARRTRPTRTSCTWSG
jgi:transaldolase